MNQLTEKQAIKMAKSKGYENLSHAEIATFQLKQDRLCMPFDVFHEAIEKTFGRPVFTHEFANKQELKDELSGITSPPTFSNIIEKLKNKNVILVTIK